MKGSFYLVSFASSFIFNLAVADNSIPDFVKKTSFGMTKAEVKKRFNGNIDPDKCAPSVSKQCTREGIKCNCARVPFISEAARKYDLWLVFGKEERVAELRPTWTYTATYQIESFLPSYRDEFADSLPDKVYDLGAAVEGYRGFSIVWAREQVLVNGLMLCPESRVSSNGKKLSDLGSCRIKIYQITSIGKEKDIQVDRSKPVSVSF